MDRITHKYVGGQAWASLNLVSKMGENECVGLPITKLARYEDLEEQGLLLKLPCKVGDTVYLIKSDGKVVPRTADMQFLGVLWDDYGKEWFLTQEEAEAKLKESEV